EPVPFLKRFLCDQPSRSSVRAWFGSGQVSSPPGKAWTMASHISAAGLYKSYWKGRNEVPVLRGVDLDVGHGEMVAVVGASGSGKSTLLHILGLLDSPDAGSVLVDSARIDNRPERQRDAMRNQLFGFIF